MWTCRDLIVLATAAVAAFGLTVTTFWPREAGAAEDAADSTARITTPTLNLDGYKVYAEMPGAKKDPVAATYITGQGPMPKLRLVVENLRDTETKADFVASYKLTPPPSSTWDRTPPTSMPGGSSSYCSVS